MGGNFEVFAPQERHIAPIWVKVGVEAAPSKISFPLCAKF